MSGRRRSARSSTSAASPSLPTIPEAEPHMETPARKELPQRRLERERYQLAGNAFAQQEFARRQMTPPDVVHPAFRPGFNLLDTTHPLPELDPSDLLARPVQSHCESAQTTMSQFMKRPPEIDLGTTPEHTPVPTQREWLETRDNLELHGGQQPQVPVIKHTPKSTAEAFASAVSAVAQNDTQADPRTPAFKTPKKSTFLERVTKWTARHTQAQSQKQKSDADRAPDLPLPPKARAVLQEAPPARGIARTPSKTKSFFSRRRSDANELPEPEPSRAATLPCHPEPIRAATSLGHRTPRSVHFETPQPTAPQSRHVSGSTASQYTSNIGRSQSLKYMDHSIPPTPPAKDTPPDEPQVRNGPQQRPAFTYETPSRARPYLSAGRLSPSQIGSNSNRGAARLVTQPSMWSMRASVVPGAMNQQDLDDARSRIGGLGIEGFNMPHETRRDTATAAYSPSVYSHDDFRRSAATFPERAATMSTPQQSRFPSPDMLAPRDTDRFEQMRQRESPDTARSTPSGYGTISMVYPDLANDPSIASFMSVEPPPSPTPQPHKTDRAFSEVEKMLGSDRKRPATNLSVAPKQEVSGKTSTSTYPVSDDSKDGLFAIPVERPPSGDGTSATPSGSKAQSQGLLHKQQPTTSSPMAHHLSAVPSPLHDSEGRIYLPQTMYTPSKPRSRKESHLALNLPKVEEKDSTESLMSPYDAPWTPSGRPKPKEDIFKTRPALATPARDALVIRQSPPVGGMRWANEATPPPGDPRKQGARRKFPAVKSPFEVGATASQLQTANKPRPDGPEETEEIEGLDDLIEMITGRDTVIQDLQNEVKHETSRLHHRLASLEIKNRERDTRFAKGYGNGEKKHGNTSRKTSGAMQQNESKSTGFGEQPSGYGDTEKKRISTSFAYDFYQTQKKTGTALSEDSVPTKERLKLPPAPYLPPPQEERREDSPTLAPGSPNPATPSAKKSESIASDNKYDELMAVVQQQQAVMMQMMQEIKDLKRSGQGPEE
ncbi:hypothetical protein CERZMDRAFT_82226 [Cercospora zeae-maydis SCOH1-5]|uniref:Uncharacterized protein n=1 Tax=Cercospora zeae-maydis SCOH1-5 TaxID=717836 RepID=A0A6A6FP32_9PEZI|nr:hypothetical protein CERZMDRAFT_82226 [Cercospora zeae-maydis SCOH1-5]